MMELRMIEHGVAKSFIETWHYSRRMPKGKNILFGWFTPEGSLYAVADYGIGVNPYQAKFLMPHTGGVKLDNTSLLELKRLCRIEPKITEAPLTKFLSLCQAELRKLGYMAIVSFSDPEHGHNGGIYKAANFKWLGQTNPEWHLIDESGEKRHRRFAFRYARRNGISIGDARLVLGVKRVKTQPKDRWLILLKKPRQQVPA